MFLKLECYRQKLRYWYIKDVFVDASVSAHHPVVPQGYRNLRLDGSEIHRRFVCVRAAIGAATTRAAAIANG